MNTYDPINRLTSHRISHQIKNPADHNASTLQCLQHKMHAGTGHQPPE